MTHQPTSIPLLRRLRASTRLAMLLLFVCLLKIGASAACAKNEIADFGQSQGDTHGLSVKAIDTETEDPSIPVGTGHACAHCDCHCHHASVNAHGVFIDCVLIGSELAAIPKSLLVSALPRLVLRPPIV